MATEGYIVRFRYNHRWRSDLWICWGISWSTLAQTLVLWTGVSQYCLQHAFPVCANFLHLNLFFCDDQLFVFVQKFAAYPALGRNTIGSRVRSHQTRHVVAWGSARFSLWSLGDSTGVDPVKVGFFVAPQGFFMCFLGLGAQISVILQSVLWSDSALTKLPGLFNARNSVIWKLQRISYYEYLWYDILHF